MPDQLRLSRQQLSKFLPDFESVKAFENLFTQATEATPAATEGLEELIYSVAGKAKAPDSVLKRLDAIEAMQSGRMQSIKKLQADVDMIKNYLGL